LGYRRTTEQGFLHWSRSALSLAQEQKAKLWELRTAVSLLPGSVRDQGLPRRSPRVYGWFTEDFDTPDLKEAKARLDELT
jgi:hypothetical protein